MFACKTYNKDQILYKKLIHNYEKKNLQKLDNKRNDIMILCIIKCCYESLKMEFEYCFNKKNYACVKENFEEYRMLALSFVHFIGQ